MSGQYSLEDHEIKQISAILRNHNIDIVWGEEDGKTIYNEVSIKVCSEDGLQVYIQVN